MFRTVPLSIIRSFSLYTQQWYMSYRFCWLLASRIRTGRPDPTVWRIPLLCVQWKTPDEGQRNCPKHVKFYSKNKFEKLVHLVGFITRIYHDVRLPERQSRDTVTLLLLLVTTIPSGSILKSLHFTQTLYLHFPHDSYSEQSVFLKTTPRVLCRGRKLCSQYGTTWIFKYNIISTNLTECIALSCQIFSNNSYNWSVKSNYIHLKATVKSRPPSGQHSQCLKAEVKHYQHDLWNTAFFTCFMYWTDDVRLFAEAYSY